MSDSSLVLVANAGDGSLSTFRLADGQLERLAVTPGLHGCSTFVVDAARNLVYAAVKGASADEPAGVVTLDLDRESGSLTARSRLDLPQSGLNYLALTRDGGCLLGASYGGGYGISCAVTDGVVGEPVSQIEFPNLHSVLASEDGAFVYFVSLGADLVAQYALADDLSLQALQPETVAGPVGCGPRHLVLSESGNAVYVLTEFSGQVLHFDRDTTTGALTLRAAVAAVDQSAGLVRSSLGLDPLANHAIWGADLHLGDGGRLLWCSERTESTLGALAVAADGSLTAPQHFIRTEPQPRGFVLSPDGAYLIAAGERSTTVSLYAVDGDQLDLQAQVETGRGANWIRFV